MSKRRVVVVGTISSTGFRDGHRFVIGHWFNTPIGPLNDVMWVKPDDKRVLLAPSREAATFITSIYEFDEVRIGPLSVKSDGRSTEVRGHGVEIDLSGGRYRPLPIARPLIITRFIEAPIARALMGVETFGTSPKGVREWYQARGWRWVIGGGASIDGYDLGLPERIERPVAVGFSEPPRRPSIVAVKVTIEFP